jgi:FAD/FMN-containing dehydrogenase
MSEHDDGLPAFSGKVVRYGDEDYAASVDQYATTSVEPGTGLMEPHAVIYCANVEDVQRAVSYAREKGVAIAVRTGGHQYLGMSSTGGQNIQVDVSRTFKDVNLDGLADDENPTITMGISYSLGELCDKVLWPNKIFVPHGECIGVHLGGHVHTGGYGMLCRAFGLLGDHVQAFRIVTADGEHRTVTRESDADLFFAVLGGSPGNFGVMTHVTLRVGKDADSAGRENYPHSRGLMAMYPYRKSHLQRLLEVMAEFNDTEDLPGDLDACITFSSPFVAFLEGAHQFLNEHESMKAYREEYDTGSDVMDYPAFIIVAAQWANLGGESQPFDPQYFQRLLEASPTYGPVVPDVFRIDLEVFARDLPQLTLGKFYVDEHRHTPLSVLTGKWIFGQNPREFNTPYVKRIYATKETRMLVERGWAASVVERSELVQGPLVTKHGCHLMSAFQLNGGKSSRTYQNRDNGTCYAWRDTSMSYAFDVFYDEYGVLDELVHLLPEKPKAWAQRWAAENDRLFIGEDGTFDREDRRFLFGSYCGEGENDDLNVGWRRYYETEEKYQRLCALKKKYDPTGVFTPNPFAVGGNPRTGGSPV